MILRILVLAGLTGWSAFAAKKPKLDDTQPTSLDSYVEDVVRRSHLESNASPGSIYSNTSRLGDAFRDVRAAQVYDLVTIVVSDNASAVSTGTSNTSRKSSATGAISSGALNGTAAATALSNLATLSGNRQIQGQGTTSRTSALTTTLTAEVRHVLPNGNLVVEGKKIISVNSERQVVTVRGIIRPDDLSPSNSIASNSLAQLEVLVNGKGIVNDSVKQPFILYRLLLGLLPF